MERPLRSVLGFGVAALCNILGRRRVVRAARFALHRSRLDVPNDPRYNGERALQRWVLAAIPPTDRLTVFDVGAHLGTWSRSLLELARRTGHRPDVHAFEPAAHTHDRLATDLPGTVHVNRLAVSDQAGERTLHVVGSGAGRNSLHHQEAAPTLPEPVVATTIDEYTAERGIEHIDVMKIDTEGHDFRVLRGARRILGRHGVAVAQFEYNHRWVHARHFLKDVFDLVGPFGYRIGKLTPRGVEWYPGWDPDLETFVEGNYVACTARMAQRLPGVRWWKDGAGSCTSA